VLLAMPRITTALIPKLPRLARFTRFARFTEFPRFARLAWRHRFAPAAMSVILRWTRSGTRSGYGFAYFFGKLVRRADGDRRFLALGFHLSRY